MQFGRSPRQIQDYLNVLFLVVQFFVQASLMYNKYIVTLQSLAVWYVALEHSVITSQEDMHNCILEYWEGGLTFRFGSDREFFVAQNVLLFQKLHYQLNLVPWNICI